jgi:hypothetical protein
VTVQVTEPSLQQQLSKARDYQLHRPGLTDTLYILYISLSTAKYVHSLPQFCKCVLQKADDRPTLWMAATVLTAVLLPT